MKVSPHSLPNSPASYETNPEAVTFAEGVYSTDEVRQSLSDGKMELYSPQKMRKEIRRNHQLSILKVTPNLADLMLPPHWKNQSLAKRPFTSSPLYPQLQPAMDKLIIQRYLKLKDTGIKAQNRELATADTVDKQEYSDLLSNTKAQSGLFTRVQTGPVTRNHLLPEGLNKMYDKFDSTRPPFGEGPNAPSYSGDDAQNIAGSGSRSNKIKREFCSQTSSPVLKASAGSPKLPKFPVQTTKVFTVEVQATEVFTVEDFLFP